MRIEDEHDDNCKYLCEGLYNCSETHTIKIKIYEQGQRIDHLEAALKQCAYECDNPICRARARKALE